MLTIIPILLLLLTAGIMAVIHRVQPKFAYFWLIAASGSFITWLVVLISGFHLPWSLTLVAWNFDGLFPTSMSLIQDSISWPFALALASLALCVILTAVTRPQDADWRAWMSVLVLTGFGILAVQAKNPLTFLLAWAALDMLDLVILLTYSTESSSRNQVIIKFMVRVCGIVLLVGAMLLASTAGENLSFDSISPQASVFLLAAVTLRFGLLPLDVPLLKEQSLRRGLGTILRLTPAAVSLVLLVRVAKGGMPSLTMSTWLVLLACLAALYGAWNWARSTDELGGRPFWIVATCGLAVAAAIQGQLSACLAWGLVCLFSGGLIFLNSVHTRDLLPFPILGLIGFSALPFSIAWNGIALYSGFHFSTILTIIFSLAILSSHALLLTGYARHLLRITSQPLSFERWVWLIYPIGLAVLVIPSYLIGLQTLPVLKELPWTSWVGGVVALILAGIFWFFSSRPIRTPARVVNFLRKFLSLRWFYSVFGILYQSSNRVIEWISSVLEGDGGVLWAMLLLVLLLSLLARQGLGG